MPVDSEMVVEDDDDDEGEEPESDARLMEALQVLAAESPAFKVARVGYSMLNMCFLFGVHALGPCIPLKSSIQYFRIRVKGCTLERV